MCIFSDRAKTTVVIFDTIAPDVFKERHMAADVNMINNGVKNMMMEYVL